MFLYNLRNLHTTLLRWRSTNIRAYLIRPVTRLFFLPQISDSIANLPVKEFERKLAESVATLRSQNKSAVYLKVAMNHAHFIPMAGYVICCCPHRTQRLTIIILYTDSALGFKFHNAEGSDATLLLWLREDTCKVPPFATHHCGVGGLVLKKDKILVVKEHGRDSKWKLPGK